MQFPNRTILIAPKHSNQLCLFSFLNAINKDSEKKLHICSQISNMAYEVFIEAKGMETFCLLKRTADLDTRTNLISFLQMIL